ncbi:head-tail connector protein [Sphingomonas sanguinis]|uniref:head-tail connector protein n=1 Tax=Sphingomonas sanguinis TaxID=33051 RepID=UPI00301904B1
MLITQSELQEWLRIDAGTDPNAIQMLVDSGADIVEHLTSRRIRPYTDGDGKLVTPIVPTALKHAIAVHVAAHFDDRAGDTTAAMMTISRLCAPFRVFSL